MLALFDLLAAAAALFLVVLLLQNINGRRVALPLPPGPTRLPIVGNLHQLPMEYQERTFAAWGKQYGDVIFLKILQKTAIVLNSWAVAQALLDKRGAKYSDRPHMVLHGELMGFNSAVTTMPYGPKTRKHRKWIMEGFSSKAALQQCRVVQQRETYILLAGLIEGGGHFEKAIERWISATIVDVTYGHRVHSLDDEYVRMAKDAMDAAVSAGNPGSVVVDFFPFLKHLPSFLPGAGFKRAAARGRVLVRRMMDNPYEMVKQKITEGTARPSFTASLLENAIVNDNLNDTEVSDIKAASAIIYAAGTDTTTAMMSAFVLAMVLNPTVFRKAQQEIDTVVGPGRLPGFEDRERLPYLECVLKELARWASIAPLALPHRLMEDDEYRGCHMPGGSIILPNIWAMTRDTNHYPDPELFLPERFLEGEGHTPALDPRKFAFGFGRRVCPGQAFAEASLFLAAACMCAALDIGKAIGADGKEITPPGTFKSGFVSQPEEFPCTIRPRSEKVAKLVAQLNADLPV